MLIRTSVSILFVLISGVFLFIPSKIHAANSCELPFLGVGLGWNLYEKNDVTALGNPWVYNWGAGGYTSHGGTGNPRSDFGDNYIPMIWGCNNGSGVRKWITDNNYSGPVLYLNEPDEAGQANCTAASAVAPVSEFLAWKNQNHIPIQVYLGGQLYGPTWLNQFISEWRKKFTTDPDIAGIHFHIYAMWTEYDLGNVGSGPIIQVMRDKLATWSTWLANSNNAWATKNGAWVTEVGLLHGSPWNNKQIANQILSTFIEDLYDSPNIAHASWFVHQAKLSEFPYYDSTSLMNANDQRTSTWTAFKNLCDGKYCQPKETCPAPTATPKPTVKPTIAPTNTPKPSPVPTNTSIPPTPTIKPSNTPVPTSTPIPCELHPEDMDCSGKVTAADLSALLQVFGSTDPKGDFDKSGKVTALDMSILLQNFGKTW